MGYFLKLFFILFLIFLKTYFIYEHLAPNEGWWEGRVGWIRGTSFTSFLLEDRLGEMEIIRDYYHKMEVIDNSSEHQEEGKIVDNSTDHQEEEKIVDNSTDHQEEEKIVDNSTDHQEEEKIVLDNMEIIRDYYNKMEVIDNSSDHQEEEKNC